MADNSSSTSNSSGLLSLFCDNITTSNELGMAATVVKTILMLPLCTIVLYLSHRQRQLSSTAASHADVFTYHMIAMQMISFFGCFCYICGRYANLLNAKLAGFYLCFMVFAGEILFQVLTCVEQYLAVVYPLTYLKLKQARGIRIRNISIGCVWLLSFTWMCLLPLYSYKLPSIPLLCALVFSLIVTSFCSLSILCVLIRPGPGEGGVTKKRVDQSKQRALRTVTTIMGLLCLWFVGYLVPSVLGVLPQIDDNVMCMIMSAAGWFNLPCSLLLPLLYLHREGKLLRCCCEQRAKT